MRTITSRVMSKAYTQPLRSFNSRTMLSMQTPLKHSSCSSLSSFHSSAAPCAASKKISIKQVKALREITSAPMVECKDALNAINEEHAELSEDEVLDKAVEWLRKKGVATAAKKGGRSAMEGLVGLRVNADATAAAVVEVRSDVRRSRTQGSKTPSACICIYACSCSVHLEYIKVFCVCGC